MNSYNNFSKITVTFRCLQIFFNIILTTMSETNSELYNNPVILPFEVKNQIIDNPDFWESGDFFLAPQGFCEQTNLKTTAKEHKIYVQ